MRPLMKAPALLAVVVLAIGALAAPASAKPKPKPKAPNTGKAGSPCKPVAFGGQRPAFDPGLDTTSLGSAAPAEYEIGNATNPEDRDAAPRRVMMFIHGGAWFVVGREALEVERTLAAQWRGAGWQTVSVSYRGCKRSVGDVVRFYDLLRQRVGPSVPICLFGQSAGGHLALMTAARRPDVSCVVSLAGPSDLSKAASQGKAEAAAGHGPSQLAEGSRVGTGYAKAAFGKRNLKVASPIKRARWIYARLLLATAKNDVLVPGGQDWNLAAKLARVHPGAYVDTMRPDPGTNPFIHGTASDASMDDLRRRLQGLVAPFGAAPAEATPEPTLELPWPLKGLDFLKRFFQR
jgi:acetyl esterase/lipase